MTARTLGPSDVARVAAQLDGLCAELDEDDRATLHAIFAWAGQAVAAQEEPPEVGGFAFDTYLSAGGLTQSFANGSNPTEKIQIMSWSWGASQVSSVGGSGGAQAGKIDLSDIIPKP